MEVRSQVANQRNQEVEEGEGNHPLVAKLLEVEIVVVVAYIRLVWL